MTNNDEYVYILDYCGLNIHEIVLTEEDKNLDSEELLHKYGVKSSTCSFMFSPIKIDSINTLTL